MRITAKQEKFADLVAGGMNYTSAYKQVYNADKMNDNSIYNAASILMDNPKVNQRIDEQKSKLEKKNLWSKEESINKLKEVLQTADEIADRSNIIKAVSELNKMLGYNEPDKLQLDTDIRINIDDD